MARINNLRYKKECVICKKEFEAKRKHAETCSEACRSQKNLLARVKKAEGGYVLEAKKEIIAEATPAIVEEAFKKQKTDPNSIEGLSIRLRAFEIALKYEYDFKKRKIIEHKMNILADQLIKLELSTD